MLQPGRHTVSSGKNHVNQSKVPRSTVPQRLGDFQRRRRGGPVAGTPSDVDVARTASDLILQYTNDGSLSVHAHSVADFCKTLHHILQDSGSVYHAGSATPAGLDLSSTSGLGGLMTDVSGVAYHGATPLTATLPPDALALNPELVTAAQQGLTDMAASAGMWNDAAASIGSLLTDGQQASNLQALAVLASERLAVLQSIDAESFQSIQASLESLLSALQSLLGSEMTVQAGQWTNSLVLAVQQLVAATRMEDATGAYSITAMAEAQNAMQGVMKSPPAGLESLLTLVMGLMALVVASIPRSKEQGKTGQMDVPLRYNPEELGAYWANKPVVVMRRSAEVVSKLVGFLIIIIADSKTGRWEQMMPQRAMEIRKIVESLGATCVKIAQAASTRVDMLPQVYLDEFTRLQDNVKTFSTVEARFVLEDGLGRPVDTVFEWLSEEPLAAASLGQVYRGKLRQEYGGNEVAVKVQRPNVLEAAALDVFIMRRAAVLFSKLPGMSDQWALVLDDWALRFFQEMDYQLEAYNTITFKKQMANLQGIMVPTIHPEFTSRKVIVSDWIDGEKLGDCKPADIKALCGPLLNCYLIQLLETGLLHADPHPGNLMRTSDGKLVILDFGLMTEVTEAQRIGLVEFIAHLTMEDWSGLTQDLVTLGFMPPNMPPEATKLIKPVMTEVFSKIVNGGGLGNAGLNFASLGLQLTHISMNYQMSIPGYFTNVIRAFSVIEGTALKVDPNYSIVSECSPYLSRRLLTDNNPRMRAALRMMLYGDGQRLDVARLQRLMASFSNFSTSVSPSASSASGPTFSSAYEERVKGTLAAPSMFYDEGPVLNETMKEALKVVFSKDGSYAQELVVEELVAATDAMSREALSEGLRLIMGSATAVAALRSVEALGPLRAMLLPIPLPMEMLHSMEPAVALTKEDRQALSTLRAVLEMVQPSAGTSLLQGIPNMAYAGSRVVRGVGEVVPLLPELLPGVQVTVEMFARQLVRRMALRLAEDLEPKTATQSQTSYKSGSGSSSSSRPQI